MITPLEIKKIHIAAKQAGLNKEQYHVTLKNVAGVDSCKALDQRSFEDVMAVFEESGFREKDKPGDYWRSKVESRSQIANSRQVHMIIGLAEQQRYCLPALCERFSGGRTQTAEKLKPQEAWQLTEMLKSAVKRESLPAAGSPRPAARKPAQAELFPRQAKEPAAVAVAMPATTPIVMEDSHDDVPF